MNAKDMHDQQISVNLISKYKVSGIKNNKEAIMIADISHYLLLHDAMIQIKLSKKMFKKKNCNNYMKNPLIDFSFFITFLYFYTMIS